MAVYRVYVEKKSPFDVEAQGVLSELRSLLGIEGLTGLRLLNRYDVEGLDEALMRRCLPVVFSEPQVDIVHTQLPEADEVEVEINPKDLQIDTYRSGGAGGQNVNKVSSAIRITHFPTGIVVQCQNERSQLHNKDMAMRILKGKLLELAERERLEHMAEIKGEMKKIEWGSQIRSYVFQPYTLVKDHRTGVEVGNIQSVIDGDLDVFINAFLVQS